MGQISRFTLGWELDDEKQEAINCILLISAALSLPFIYTGLGPVAARFSQASGNAKGFSFDCDN